MRTIYKLACVAVAALCTGCANDLTDGAELPDGKYPLQITGVSVTADVQTRVSENTTDGSGSVWTSGDQIQVQIGDDTSQQGTYTVMAEANGNFVELRASKALFWRTATAQRVKGWYPVSWPNPMALNNQSDNLVYALYAETATAVNYNSSSIELPFSNQLAKVRIVVDGTKQADVTKVELFTYPACTFTPAAATKIAGSGTPTYISMRKTSYNGATYCWEANVVPTYPITKVRVNGTECALTTSVTPVVGSMHEVTITANAKRNFKSVYTQNDYYQWDAYLPYQSQASGPWGANSAWPNNTGNAPSQSCKDCPSYADLINYINAGPVYWDNGTEGDASTGLQTYTTPKKGAYLGSTETQVNHAGLWLMKRNSWPNSISGSAATVSTTKLDTANAHIRTDGDYFFLPAAGNYITGNSNLYDTNSYGSYWSSTRTGNGSAYYLVFYQDQALVRDVTSHHGFLPMVAE